MANGYIMVDCKSLNLLADASQTINSLYESSIEAIMSGKPIIAVNCEYGENVPMTPIPVMAIIEAGVAILTTSILQIRVANDDSVTIVPLIDSNNKTAQKSAKKS